MPLKNLGKPNIGSKLKTAMNVSSVPRSAPQRAGKVGQLATNNKIVSTRGGSRGGGNSMPKRGKRMY